MSTRERPSIGLAAALRDVSLRPPPAATPAAETHRSASDRSAPPAAGSWRGDLAGGFTAAVIALPLALAFGVAVFSPLGPEYAPLGALAGLTAAVVGGFLAAALGGTPAQVTGPTGPMSVVLGATLAAFVADPPLPGPVEAQIPTILTLTFLAALLGGAVQMGLGLLKIGRLVRYVPYPVTAGFMNGIALIILLGQLPLLLGLPRGASLVHDLGALSPPTLAVGAITAVAILITSRLSRRIPSPLVGLGAGTAAYYALGAAGYDGGAVVGAVPSAIPTPDYAMHFFALGTNEAVWAAIPRVIGPALALGALGAIDSLLTSVVADVATGTRHDSRRELIGQGIGNMVSALFGGLSGAGTTVATMVNVKAGGRTRRAGMSHSLVLLVVLLVAAPLAGGVPLSVLAAILIVTAVGMLDGWTRRLAITLARRARSRRELWTNLAVIALVTVLTVAVDLMVAVAIGLVIAALLFVGRMGRRIVRRVQSGHERRSFREREPDEVAVLQAHGDRVAVLELDGALFFGSTQTLVDTVERLSATVDYFILDAHHVTVIDGTGARTLAELPGRLRERGKDIAVSHVASGHPLWGFLGDMGDVESLGEDHFFIDTDHALEWAEDRVLADHGALRAEPPRVTVEEMHVARDLGERERETLLTYLEEATFEAGEQIVVQGELSRTLWIPLEGCLSVTTWNACEGRPLRLTTVKPGVVVGERGFFEGVPHSVTVTAQTDGHALVLTQEAFARMSIEDPELTMKLLFNVTREVCGRLHRTTQTAAAVDH